VVKVMNKVNSVNYFVWKKLNWDIFSKVMTQLTHF